MYAIINGMAVLFFRIFFVILAYMALSKVNWRSVLQPQHQAMDRYLCILCSIGLGYLTSSFFITIIETLRLLLMSAFL
ncbi:DUF1146 family protein [Facklamia sp. P12945]|uniref:DUF1146 family protein n=2 Tax=unclassified Facklamia TaxID=2622293 RepID=UPI003D168E76